VAVPRIGDTPPEEVHGGGSDRTLTSMWNRRNKAAAASAAAPSATPSATPSADLEQASLLETFFPGAVEEHPAKRRIRRSNELADAMRQTGGRHRLEIPSPRTP